MIFNSLIKAKFCHRSMLHVLFSFSNFVSYMSYSIWAECKAFESFPQYIVNLHFMCSEMNECKMSWFWLG